MAGVLVEGRAQCHTRERERERVRERERERGWRESAREGWRRDERIEGISKGIRWTVGEDERETRETHLRSTTKMLI